VAWRAIDGLAMVVCGLIPVEITQTLSLNDFIL
jgi:hypothetical protein